MMNKILAVFGLVCLLVWMMLGSSTAHAETFEDPSPKRVDIGVYVSQVYDMSLKDNKFSADFYVWFRWKEKDIKPYESFEIVNGRADSKEVIYNDDLDGGIHYAVVRVSATMTKFWDISRFPLDNHVLTIEIEDAQNEEFKLKYVADVQNTKINPQVQVPGWILAGTTGRSVGHVYKTNYGDISLPPDAASTYSRFVFAQEIKRPGYGYFLKLFLSVFISALIAMLALLIKPTDLDPRFGLGIGAIFAAVASEYVVASSLPDSNLLTLADRLHILAILFIFLSIFESIISLKLFSSGREAASRRMDRILFSLMLVVYLASNLLVVIPR